MVISGQTIIFGKTMAAMHQITQPPKPIDMARPTHNDIMRYEIYCVQSNRYMSKEEKEVKVAQLLSEMTRKKDS